MRVKLEFSKGFDQLLEQYRQLGGKAEEACVECIEEGQKALYDAYYNGLARHERSGAALESLEIEPVVRDGNEFSGRVGSSIKKNERGFFHARYQEYGAKTRKGAVTFAMDPWRAPADAEIKKKFAKICRDIMKRRMKL